MVALHDIVILLKTIAGTVFLLCAMVMMNGGWVQVGKEYRSTRLQKSFSVTNLLVAITLFGEIWVALMPAQPSVAWLRLIEWSALLPLAMLLIQSVHLRQQRPTWRHWLIAFGPLVVYLVVILVCKDTYPMAVTHTNYVCYLYVMVMYGIILYRLRRWDREMMEEYSDIARKQTKWFRQLTLPFILLVLLWVPMAFWPETAWLEIVYYIVDAVLAVAMSAYVMAQEEWTMDSPCAIPEKGQDSMEGIRRVSADCSGTQDKSPEPLPAWADNLTAAMVEQHLYRNPELTATMLAQTIGTNRTYLSRYFSEQLQTTFYDYINTYRIEDAKILLTTTDLSTEQIAVQCGFSSRTAFSRTFRDKTALAPTDYRKQETR